MRVAIDARPLNHPKTGIGRYTTELVSRLAQAPDLELFLYSNAPIDQTLPESVRVRTGNSRSAFSSLYAQLIFPLWARQDSADVFWSPRHHLPLLLRLLSVRSVVTIHDMVWKKQPGSMRRGGRLIEQCLMPPSLAMADQVIAVSQSTKRDLTEFDERCKPKTTVVYCGSSFPITSAAEPANLTLLFVGTFEPRKNLATLLSAFVQIIASEPSAHLILAGKPGWKVDIEEEIEAHELSASVTVNSVASDAELAQLYCNCTLLVMPSWYEGFGLPVLEAMSFGKPVVVANRSSLPEVAGSAGILFSPNNPEQLAEAVTQLYRDPVRYASLSANAHQQAQAFDWNTAAQLTHEAFARAYPNPAQAQ